MQPDEVIGTGDAVADVVELITDTVQDMHAAITTRGFDRATRLLGSVVTPIRSVHDRVVATTYRGVRLGLSAAVKVASRFVAVAGRHDDTRLTDHPHGNRIVGILNGVVGDRLAELRNPLDLRMTLRHEGGDLAPTPRALAAAYPDATGRIAVFVPGLCETEVTWRHRAEDWHADDQATHGDRLRRDLGLTPLWVRYNTGRRVSDNSADLDRLLATVAQHWPTEVEEIVLVGYSMGGLVIRGAVHLAASREAAWVREVRHVLSLGTPHHGVPLEKFANTATWSLNRFAETRPLAAFFNRRSAGIKDLRYGNVLREDWHGHDPDLVLRDTRVPTQLVDSIEHHAIGARFTAHPIGHVVGDLMVRLPSATGRHAARTLAFQRQTALQGLHHVALRNHPVVYDHLRSALDGPVAAPGRRGPHGDEPG